MTQLITVMWCDVVNADLLVYCRSRRLVQWRVEVDPRINMDIDQDLPNEEQW